MYVNRLVLKDFRNIKSIDISPCRGVNIIHGENAQGKTNLVEGLWMFTGQRSFRRAKERELIRFGQNRASLDLEFFGGGRQQYADITLGEKKSMTLNGVPLSGASELAGQFYAVVFSPEHLTLIKDGPAERRRFLDDAISQLMPRYSSHLLVLARVLSQRAALLSDMQRCAGLESLLDMWDEQLAKVSAAIIKARLRYCQLLREHAEGIYRGISSGRESFEIFYAPSTEGLCGESGDTEIMLAALRQSRAEDIKNAANTIGPHRDDIEINLDGISARMYGSQGQQRSCTLALKLAQCEIIKESTGSMPVVILDDVLSELDKLRRDYLLAGMEGRQVFITCCDTEYFVCASEAAIFNISGGSVQQQE